MPYQPKLLQLLIENARDFAVVMVDIQGRIIVWNTGAQNVLGWQEAEIIGQPAAVFYTPEDRAAGVPEQEMRTAREQGRAEDERWHVRKDGSRFWGSGLAQPVHDDAGALQGYTKIFRDLTEQRRAKETARVEQERLQATLNAAEVGTWTVQANPDHATGDTLLHTLFGLTAEEAANATPETYIRCVHPDDAPFVAAALQHSMQTGEKLEAVYRVLHPDGATLWIDTRGRAMFNAEGQFLHLYGTVMNVTARKEAEYAKEQAQIEAEHDRRMLGAVLDALPAGVIIADPVGKILLVNAASERIWGGKIMSPDVEGYRDYVGYWRATGKRVQPHEWAMARALQGELCPGDLVEIERLNGGEAAVIVNSAAPVRDATGAIVGGVVAEVDVTAQIRAEEALRLSEEKYRLLFNSVDQGFAHCEIILNGDGQPMDYRFLEVNPAFEQMTGLVDAAGRTACDLVPGLETWWAQTYGRVALTGEPIRFQYGSQVMGRFFDVYAAPTGQGRFVLLFTDITARRTAEQERELQVAEIEALNARLARAMQETHHRVKNNLQVIAALVELQADALGNGSAVQRLKQHVRALATIHDMLTQQAKADTDTSVVSARDVLLRLIPILQATSGERRITADITDVPLTVQKATSLALLVSECVGNAIKHTKGNVEIVLRVEDGMARLEVCDEGPGFPPDFDPRKAANTGLELIESTARWDLRGELSYENQEQGGGRVVVTFPLDAQSEA